MPPRDNFVRFCLIIIVGFHIIVNIAAYSCSSSSSSSSRRPTSSTNDVSGHTGEDTDEQSSWERFSYEGNSRRRAFFERIMQQSVATCLSGSFITKPRKVNAELIMFPLTKPLVNKYILMRAGTTLLEEEDIWSTNPLFLTNRESGLSERGITQVQEALKALTGNDDTTVSVIKYSFAASSMDTAEIAKNTLQVGQNRVVPGKHI